MARNVIMEGCGILRDCRYLLHDRDTKYTKSFRAIIASGQVEPLTLPARSPNLNAFAERWVRSVKEECLSKVILLGECSLRRALKEYVEHYHAERNHQGSEESGQRHELHVLPERPYPTTDVFALRCNSSCTIATRDEGAALRRPRYDRRIPIGSSRSAVRHRHLPSDRGEVGRSRMPMARMRRVKA